MLETCGDSRQRVFSTKRSIVDEQPATIALEALLSFDNDSWRMAPTLPDYFQAYYRPIRENMLNTDIKAVTDINQATMKIDDTTLNTNTVDVDDMDMFWDDDYFPTITWSTIANARNCNKNYPPQVVLQHFDNNLTSEIAPFEIDRKIATISQTLEPPSDNDVDYMVNGDYDQYQYHNHFHYHVHEPYITCLTGGVANQQGQRNHNLKGLVRSLALSYLRD